MLCKKVVSKGCRKESNKTLHQKGSISYLYVKAPSDDAVGRNLFNVYIYMLSSLFGISLVLKTA